MTLALAGLQSFHGVDQATCIRRGAHQMGRLFERFVFLQGDDHDGAGPGPSDHDFLLVIDHRVENLGVPCSRLSVFIASSILYRKAYMPLSPDSRESSWRGLRV